MHGTCIVRSFVCRYDLNFVIADATQVTDPFVIADATQVALVYSRISGYSAF
jgi:hypothetical protein